VRNIKGFLARHDNRTAATPLDPARPAEVPS